MNNDTTLPYQCEDTKCKCYNKDNLLRHCPICNFLYLYDENTMEPCTECMTMNY